MNIKGTLNASDVSISEESIKSAVDFAKSEYKKSTNIFNLSMEIGDISTSTGADSSSTIRVRTIGYIPVKHTTYYFTRSDSTGAIGIRLYKKDGTFLKNWVCMTSGQDANWLRIDSGAEKYGYKEDEYLLRFIQETTSTDVEYTITSGDILHTHDFGGEQGVDLIRREYSTSKNLLDNDNIEMGDIISKGTVDSSSTIYSRTINFITVTPNTYYTLSADAGTITQGGVKEYTSTDMSTGTFTLEDFTELPYTFKTASTTNYIRIVFKFTNNTTLNNKNIQLEQGTRETVHDTYKGQLVHSDIGNWKMFVNSSGSLVFTQR